MLQSAATSTAGLRTTSRWRSAEYEKASAVVVPSAAVSVAVAGRQPPRPSSSTRSKRLGGAYDVLACSATERSVRAPSAAVAKTKARWA